MDRDRGRTTGLRLLPPVKCSPGFRADLWLSLQSEGTLAPGPTQFWQSMGLERTADNVIRPCLARNFSGSANCPRHSRPTGSGLEHSGTRIEISSGRRSAYAQSFGPRLLPATCSNLSHRRRTLRQFCELSVG